MAASNGSEIDMANRPLQRNDIVDAVLIADALHNMSPDAGATPEYARGVLVGAVSALMAVGMSFDRALHLCSLQAPRVIMPMTVPPSWLKGFDIKAKPAAAATVWRRDAGRA
jgi:hypothetical protein